LIQSFVRKAGRFRSLRRDERRILLASVALLPIFAVGLRSMGLRRFHRLLQRAVRTPTHAADPRRMAAMVNAAARVAPLGATCLTRSLLLQWWLNRWGVASDLRIGVRMTDDGALNAHAWIEREGVPLNDRAGIAADFAPFPHLAWPPSKP